MSEQPHSLEAEQAVLACALLEPSLAKRVAEEVQEADFFLAQNRLIWGAIARVHGKDQALDLTTLIATLEATGKLDEVGGVVCVVTLDELFPDAGSFDSYLGLLRDYRLRRELLRAAGELHRAALEDGDPATTLSTAATKLRHLERHLPSEGYRPITELVADGMRALERRKPGGAWGLPSGLTDLDRITQGFDNGAVVVIGGRPGHGKTSLGMQIARHAALDLEIPAGVVSLEMSAKELAFRVLSAESGIDYAKIRSDHLREMQRRELEHTARKCSGLPLWIDATATQTAQEIAMRARRLHREHVIRLLVLDYLQLVPGGEEHNRNLELAAVSRTMKLVAKELDLPVVVLAQLSRKCEEEKRRPRLSDLRDSGAIEQDADVVIFTHRQFLYDEKPENARIAELIVAKQRNGPTAAVRVAWVPETMVFQNAAH